MWLTISHMSALHARTVHAKNCVEVAIEFMATEEQTADTMTKALPKYTHTLLRHHMGMVH
jgi:hypothetical protein